MVIYASFIEKDKYLNNFSNDTNQSNLQFFFVSSEYLYILFFRNKNNNNQLLKVKKISISFHFIIIGLRAAFVVIFALSQKHTHITQQRTTTTTI